MGRGGVDFSSSSSSSPSSSPFDVVLDFRLFFFFFFFFNEDEDDDGKSPESLVDEGTAGAIFNQKNAAKPNSAVTRIVDESMMSKLDLKKGEKKAVSCPFSAGVCLLWIWRTLIQLHFAAQSPPLSLSSQQQQKLFRD